MKNNKKLAIITFGVLLLFPFFITNVKCATTIGDTTFPADVGDVYTWQVTDDRSGGINTIGNMVNITIEAVYKGQHNSVDALMVNCTLTHYYVTTSLWTPKYDNAFYMAANETQDYINVSSNFMSLDQLIDHSFITDKLFVYLISTPINLSALGLMFMSNPLLDSYEVVGNDLTIFWGSSERAILSFSPLGILTRWEEKMGNFLQYIIELITPMDGDGENGEDGVSFGSYFLIFALISVVGLVFLKKKYNK